MNLPHILFAEGTTPPTKPLERPFTGPLSLLTSFYLLLIHRKRLFLPITVFAILYSILHTPVSWSIVLVLPYPSLYLYYFFPTSASKSKSRYDRRSVGQSVLVSSPIWGSWPDINYCLTFTVLSMSGLSFILTSAYISTLNLHNHLCENFRPKYYKI
jgi:hypothetical protein